MKLKAFTVFVDCEDSDPEGYPWQAESKKALLAALKLEYVAGTKVDIVAHSYKSLGSFTV